MAEVGMIGETASVGAQVEVLRRGSGFAALDDGWIAMTGEDRVRWLNGMVTNSVQALTPGDGAYTFVLSAQGRIQGDGTVWAEPERLLLQTSSAQAGVLLPLLDRFIIMDDVELTDVSAGSHGLLLTGPAAASTLTGIGFAARASRLLRRQRVEWQGRVVHLATAYSPLVPRFELWCASVDDRAALVEALQAAGATACGAEAVELLRVLEGTPRVGVDIRDRDLAQETGQTRALHFSKGCYLGQEIVERIRSRGNVHRTFTSFVLTGDVPAAGAPILGESDGAVKPVGELTSIATEAVDGQRIALGYIRREALERGLPLSYAGGQMAPRQTAAEPQPAVAAS